jgi:hypothetical protein
MKNRPPAPTRPPASAQAKTNGKQSQDEFSDRSENDEELTEAEVLAYLAPVARRLADALGARPGLKSEILDLLRSDEGAVELLAAAFDSGVRDATTRSAVAFESASGGKAVLPDWSDVEDMGERLAIHREESICENCSHVAVCRAVPPDDMLVSVRRCLRYVPADDPEE